MSQDLPFDVLCFDEFRFPILKDKATLHALVSNATDFRLNWMINIHCDEAKLPVDSETNYYSLPRLYHESMILPCRNWKELEGCHIVSTAEDDEPPAIYLGWHNDLDESDIYFAAREGVKFDVDWKFGCSGKKGRVRTKVIFTEVTVWLEEVQDEATARRRLEQDLDLSLLSGPEIVLHPSSGPRFKFKPIP